SALTVAMLKDLEVDQEAAFTGTINSGELIGPVGSLMEKLVAAKESGIKTVLIPAVQSVKQEDNETDIIEYGEELGVEVVPVATLSDAVQQLTGKEFEEKDLEIDVPESYNVVMKEVAEDLCDRVDVLLEDIDVFDLEGKKEVDLEQVNRQREVFNLTEKGKTAFESENHYSAASYCFGAGVKASALRYELAELPEEERLEESERLMQRINEFDKQIDEREKQTITDLQTYMIVKERVLEARQYLATGENDSQTFGYVTERLNSAVAWSRFFDQGGTAYDLDEESLQGSCSRILADVDERFQYLNLFFPGLLNDLRNNLITAHKHYETGEYALCVYLASRTKAEANIIVTMLGVKEDFADDLLELKMNAAEKAVAKQIDKGAFPIIAYSYYEYANSLKEDDLSSALLYSEYALELSDIEIYFEKKSHKIDWSALKPKLRKYVPTVTFIWGLILGFILCWIIFREKVRGKAVRKAPAKARRRTPPARKVKRRKTRTSLRLR
ncbi:hypothetical protein KY349_02295, partial [Candidatus Woesearchaeota archaeon]|nr:hypothetical protein [Candidatus Woesearchaeota archaeon]